MKKVITLFAAMLIMIMGSTMNAHAQINLTNEQKAAMVENMKQQLPMKLDEGITWTDASISSDGQTFNMPLLVNASTIGLSNAAMREALVEIGADGFKEMLGDEFLSTIRTFGLDCNITMKFNDSTPSLSLLIRR